MFAGGATTLQLVRQVDERGSQAVQSVAGGAGGVVDMAVVADGATGAGVIAAGVVVPAGGARGCVVRA